MKITFEKQGEIKILPIFKGEKVKDLSKETQDWIESSKSFSGDLGETFALVAPGQENVVLVGLGKKEEFDYESIRTMSFKAMRFVEKLNVEQANFIIEEIPEFADPEAFKAILEGALQTNYSFDKYKTLDKKEKVEAMICIEAQWCVDKEKYLEEVENMMEGVTIARNLVNEPPIYMTPDRLAQSAKELLEPLGVKVTIYDEKELEEMGMEGLLSVGGGSDNPPRFIKMEYTPQGDDEQNLVLVGKGLTYDSGGYSIKPTNSMVDMKSDMAGSAAVIGAMAALAKNKGTQNVTALVAACENLISGHAYKPGDIVGTMAGKTIEVLNTDAEGRITLADALYYGATKCNPRAIIDTATLTGAAVVALGSVFTAALSNDEELYLSFKKASENAGENIWLMPSHESYRDMIKGDLADIKNSVPGGAGMITAGMFLEHFVEDVPWIHLDIAGTSYLSKSDRYLPKGATGVMVKTFYEFAK